MAFARSACASFWMRRKCSIGPIRSPLSAAVASTRATDLAFHRAVDHRPPADAAIHRSCCRRIRAIASAAESTQLGMSMSAVLAKGNSGRSKKSRVHFTSSAHIGPMRRTDCARTSTACSSSPRLTRSPGCGVCLMELTERSFPARVQGHSLSGAQQLRSALLCLTASSMLR